MTQEELDRKVASDIEEVGWHVVGVEPSESRPGWAYTIGLAENFGHPELVEVDPCCWPCSHTSLNVIGDRIRDGARFDVDDEVIDTDGKAKSRIGAVHPHEWTTDRFAGWLNHYGDRPEDAPPLEAVQALWVRRSGLWQDSVDNPRWPADCLALPPSERPLAFMAPLPARPNRAQRRARARRRHQQQRRR